MAESFPFVVILARASRVVVNCVLVSISSRLHKSRGELCRLETFILEDVLEKDMLVMLS